MNASEASTVPSRLTARLCERPLVGYCTWELATAPADWAESSAAFDEVWTLSAFSAAALAPSCPVPVLVFPPCLAPPHATRSGRADFGLADGEFVVLFAFDLQSEMERKNPLALVEAFRRAFHPHDRARLMLKVTSSRQRPEERRRLEDAAEGLSVTILDRTLERGALHDLVGACDVYASLHRSEGFFMNPWNSFPVPFRLAEVTRDAGPYRRGEPWAEPDVDAAAALLRRVFEDREGARAVAARGRAEIQARLSPFAIGAGMAARLRQLDGERRGP